MDELSDIQLRDILWNIRYRYMLDRRMSNSLYTHKLYNIWIGMLDRCYNPNSDSFPLYGARGIDVCERWFSLKSFIEDMKESYGLTLDRKNPDGDYTPENCRWASRKTQSMNVRKSSKENRQRIHSWIMIQKKLSSNRIHISAYCKESGSFR